MRSIHLLPGVLLLVIASCSSFFSDFNRIDENKLRVIGISYLPTPDVVPGDTVTARAYFGGNDVVGVENFAWAVQGFGDRDTTRFDEKPLQPISTRSWLPDSFEFTFALPESLFVKERLWFEDSAVADSAARLMLQPRDAVMAYVGSLSEVDQQVWIDRIRRLTWMTGTLFTARSQGGATLRTLGVFSSRYNSRYPEILPVNHNPSITWMAACAVPRASAMGFDPTSPPPGSRWTYLYNFADPSSERSEVEIDTGLTYFFVADNQIQTSPDSLGGLRADTLWDFDRAGDGSLVRERYRYTWFYQNRDEVTAYQDSMLQIDAMSNTSYVEFKPPTATAMRTFVIWVNAQDEFRSSRYARPVGTCVRGVSGVFTYTNAYRRAYIGARAATHGSPLHH